MESQIEARMPVTDAPTLDVSDIQATVLRPRPRPYRGQYVILRIDDAVQGREMLGRLLPHVAPADEWWAPTLPGWLGIAFTYQGLKALGVPQASLESFPQEFREGMAARAAILNDVGNNTPAKWEYPFGTADMHWRSTRMTTKASRRCWSEHDSVITTSLKSQLSTA